MPKIDKLRKIEETASWWETRSYFFKGRSKPKSDEQKEDDDSPWPQETRENLSPLLKLRMKWKIGCVLTSPNASRFRNLKKRRVGTKLYPFLVLLYHSPLKKYIGASYTHWSTRSFRKIDILLTIWLFLLIGNKDFAPIIFEMWF